MSKTVIIADDHPFTVEGMENVIQQTEQLRVVGRAANGIEAISVIKKHTPDCAILDLSMPGANGLEVFMEAKRWSPETRFVIVTGISAAVLFQRLYDAGIDGLFVKNSPPEEIRDGILQVLEGERVISTAAQDAIKKVEKYQHLSEREIEVLKAISKGLTNRQIADDLGLSPKTVDSHRTSLLRKMNVNSTASLLVAAMRMGLLDV